MSVEELLKPRYKVIADYPSSPYVVGKLYNSSLWGKTDETLFFDKYPHLFKKLEWWEERKESDMPEYVKYIHERAYNYEIIPFSKFKKEHESYEGAELEWIFGSYHISLFLPATKEEYENQFEPEQVAKMNKR